MLADRRSARAEFQSTFLDLWVLRVAVEDVTQFDLSMLDDDERRRAAALAVPDDRRRYVASHLVVRYLLGSYLGIPPSSVAYFREPCACCGAPHGRPALDKPTRPLHFSVSRSGGLALIGIATARVGVDVEAISQRDTVAEVSPLLHPAERTEIFSAMPSKRAAAFTRIWTRKEAYLKGMGLGVTHDLMADYLGTEQHAVAPMGWTVVAAPVPAGYAGAAAVQGQWGGGSN